MLAGIDKVYAENRVRAEYEMVLEYLRSSVNLFNFGWTAVEAAAELKKPDLERDAAYMDRNWAQTKQRLQLAQRNYHDPTDKAIFKELLLRALRLKGSFRIKALDDLFKADASENAAFLGKNFIPDANGTLRLTYGRVKGYSPADAVYYKPFTTLAGVLDKTTGQPPFNTPSKLFDLYKARDFGRFAHPDLKDVPVCMLYDADTTGGNSGSPVLNAQGELVGVNFDRTYDATINDYAWSEDYSRSIAVDIRYVLWVTQKFGGAGFLLEEMGIK